MERRYRTIAGKPVDLPVDYLKMIAEVFKTNFDPGLKALAKIRPNPRFEANGIVAADEVVLAISLLHENEVAATTLYASADFDPKASSPTAEELLAACVDAIGSVFATLLDPARPERLKQLADQSLSALENVPFDWTLVEIDRHKIWVKIDTANLSLDRMTDRWLSEHDPEARGQEEEEQREAEKLFITGPRGPEKGTRH